MLVLVKNTHFFKKACRYSKKVPVASLKRSKHGLGTSKRAFSKKARLFSKKNACGCERLVSMAWGYQSI